MGPRHLSLRQRTAGSYMSSTTGTLVQSQAYQQLGRGQSTSVVYRLDKCLGWKSH